MAFLLLVGVSCVLADAEPGHYRSYGHYGGYGGYGHHGYYGKREAEAVAEPGYYSRYGHYGGYGGYGHHGYYGKREAEAGYGYAAPATGASIVIRGYGTPATVGTCAPYGYAASGSYVADSFGAVHIAKRDAEAEPGYYRRYGHYGGYGHHGYYGKRDAGVIGYSAYASPLIYSGAYGYAASAIGASIAIRGYGTPATVGSYAPYGYAASGAYVADSVGAVHVA